MQAQLYQALVQLVVLNTVETMGFARTHGLERLGRTSRWYQGLSTSTSTSGAHAAHSMKTTMLLMLPLSGVENICQGMAWSQLSAITMGSSSAGTLASTNVLPGELQKRDIEIWLEFMA